MLKDEPGKLKKLSEPEKRIFIVQTLTKCYIDLAWKSRVGVDDGMFTQAFYRTGAILPIDGSKNHEVTIQGFDKYCFSEQVTEAKIKAAEEQLKEEIARKTVIRDEQSAKVRSKKQERLEKFSSHVELFKDAGAAGALLLPQISSAASSFAQEICKKIASHLKCEFFGYGSFFSRALQSAIPADRLIEGVPELMWDDVDIGCGTLGFFFFIVYLKLILVLKLSSCLLFYYCSVTRELFL
jgi:hypothetical protein